ncbi:MAG: hypothetical protein AB1589_17970 [Cyanobacteriota bacterium]
MTTASNTCRNPRLWPFAAHSIWNRPIGNGANYVYAGLTSADYITFDEEAIILTPNAPIMPVYWNATGWDKDKSRCSEVQGKLRDWPIPSDFNPDFHGTTPNASAAALSRNGTIEQTQPLAICSPGSYATSKFNSEEYTDLFSSYGNDALGAHGGSGLSAIGGSIRAGELLPGGEIKHAIKINVWAAKYLAYNNDGSPGYRWPAIQTDEYANPQTYGGKNPAVEMGALLALKPDFREDSLQSIPGRILARALKRYGGYIVDDTHWDAFAIATAIETVDMGNGNIRTVDVGNEFKDKYFKDKYGYKNIEQPLNSNPWTKDIQKIFENLHVVNNNHPGGTYAGGGNSGLAPIAPPFCQ